MNYKKIFGKVCNCNECKYENEDNGQRECKCCEEFWTLRELVEKSVPKKVFESSGLYACPSCNKWLQTKILEFSILSLKEVHYCPKCGQALDWSEIEECKTDIKEN